ncbi:MAG: hypothetical protein WDO06_08810 [Actinomycetota bacterium]
MSDKKIENLGLRRLAPEVLIADIDAKELIQSLRTAGYLPAAESATGVLLAAPRLNRAKSKPRPSTSNRGNGSTE